MIKIDSYKSVIFLQILKGIELLIPILSIPMIIQAFGLNIYGMITLFLSVSSYLIMLGDWGVNINVVKELSQSQNKKYKWLVLFFEIQSLKIVYSLGVLILFLSISFFYNVELYLTFCCWLWVFFTVLQCRWYFQAFSRLPEFVMVSIISKIPFVIYIFVFLDKSSSLNTYFTYLALSVGVSCCYSVCVIIKETPNKCFKKLRFSINISKACLALLFQGWFLVSSRLISNAVNPVILMIIKLSYGLEVVGLIGVFQKIASGIIALLTPIIEVTYPKMAKLYKVDKSQASVFFNKVHLLIFSIVILLIITCYYLGEHLLKLLGVTHTHDIVVLLTLYMSVCFFGVASSLFVNLMVINGSTKKIVKVSLISSISAVFFMFVVGAVELGYFYVVFSLLIPSFFSYVMFYYLERTQVD